MEPAGGDEDRSFHGDYRTVVSTSHGRFGRTGSVAVEGLIGSLAPPINGLARPSAEDARLVPQPDLISARSYGWQRTENSRPPSNGSVIVRNPIAGLLRKAR